MARSELPHAVLPESLEARNTIDLMKVGQHVFISPWAMWVDLDGKCWLNPKYQVESTGSGILVMPLVLDVDGYHVFPPRGATWVREAKPKNADYDYLPVAELHVGTDEVR